MRFFLRAALALAFAPFAACTVPTGPIDGGPCAADLSVGSACTTDNTACMQTARCTLCGRDRYTRFAATCTCTGGYWYCTVPDCSATTVGVFVDSACTVPVGADGGSDVNPTGDVPAVLDASDGSDGSDDIASTDGPSTDGCAPVPDGGPASDAGCSAGRVSCSGVCVDLNSDARHCGACGNECLAWQICVLGTCGCECAAGLTVCSSGCGACACYDLRSDPTHCGTCTTACASGESCVSGICVGADGG